MALQSSFYPVDGRSKTYAQTKHIASKQHAAVYSRLISTNTWTRLSNDGWKLINNSIVLIDAFSSSVYDQIEIRIADDASELTDSISDIAVVASISTEIVSLANDKATLDSLYGDKITLDSLYADKATLDSIYADKIKLDSIYADKAKLDSIYADKAKLDSIYADKIKLDSLYADKATLDSIYADKIKLDSIYADKATLDSIYADKIGLDAIYTNLAVILDAANQATAAANSATSSANSATASLGYANASQLRAWEAEAEYLTAMSYAIEAEDVEVKHYTSDGDGTFTATPQTGVYSALHYKNKSATYDPALKVSKAGDTMTGTLVAPNIKSLDGGTSGLQLDTSATDLDYIGIRFAKQNIQKWLNYVDNTATSDLYWQRRKDDGTLTTVMKMIRDTVQVDFSFMPTVAGKRIVESGTNANGIYVKFSDGTMICRGTSSLETTNTAFGSLFHNGTPNTYTFPATFVSVPKVTVTIRTVVNQYCWAGTLNTVGLTSFGCRVISQGNTGQASFDWIAIGTW